MDESRLWPKSRSELGTVSRVLQATSPILGPFEDPAILVNEKEPFERKP